MFSNKPFPERGPINNYPLDRDAYNNLSNSILKCIVPIVDIDKQAVNFCERDVLATIGTRGPMTGEELLAEYNYSMACNLFLAPHSNQQEFITLKTIVNNLTKHIDALIAKKLVSNEGPQKRNVL